MTQSNGNGEARRGAQSFEIKVGLAEMLKGGVIMDVTNAEQAKIAEEAGAAAVMALERVPADIRKEGGVARMCSIEVIEGIQRAVSIPVMAKVRIGHFVEARVLEALGVDFIDESEVLTPADEEHHVDKHDFRSPFVCGARNLGEALRRIGEGAAMIRTKGEAGSGNIVEAVRHLRAVTGEIRALAALRPEEVAARAKELRRPTSWWRGGARRAAAGAELRRRRHRHARRRRAVHGARRRGGVRRLGHLQERGPGRARARDRARDHALGRPRGGARGEPRPRGGDARHRDGEARRARAAREPRLVGGAATARSASSRSRATSRRTRRRSRAWAPRRCRVRRAKDLDGLDALILPGGESTTISKGLERLALYEPIEAFARAGRPVLGTCAGAILLAREVENHPVRSLGLARRRRGAQRLRHAGRLVRGARGGGRRGRACAASSSARRGCAGPGPTSRCSRASTAGRSRCARATSGRRPSTPSSPDDPRVHAALVDGSQAASGRYAVSGPRARLRSSAPSGPPCRSSARASGAGPAARGRRPGGILREYEFTFVVQPEISDEGVQAISQRFEGILAQPRAPRSSSTKTGAAGASPTRSRTSRRATTRSCTSSPTGRWCRSSSAPRGSTTRSCAS